MLPLLALAVGVYLGLRSNVFILAPLCTLGVTVSLAGCFWGGKDILDNAGELILPFTTVQMGYFVGLMSRDSLALWFARFDSGSSKQI